MVEPVGRSRESWVDTPRVLAHNGSRTLRSAVPQRRATLSRNEWPAKMQPNSRVSHSEVLGKARSEPYPIPTEDRTRASEELSGSGANVGKKSEPLPEVESPGSAVGWLVLTPLARFRQRFSSPGMPGNAVDADGGCRALGRRTPARQIPPSGPRPSFLCCRRRRKQHEHQRVR